MILRLACVCALAGVHFGSNAYAQVAAPLSRNEHPQTKDSLPGGSSHRVLAIGITKYDELPVLEFTTTDAREVVRAFSEVGGLGQDRVTLLVDDTRGEDRIASQDLDASVSNFLQSCSSSETAILFFSGHGVRLGSDFSLAASDFHSQDGLSGVISMDRLRSTLSKSKAKTKVVILDCCHSGGFGAAPSDIASSLRSVPGCVVIAASRPSEASLETHTLKSGVFTHWLVRGLRGAANTKVDAIIDTTELFEYVSQGVRASTSSVQSPAIAFDQSTNIPTIIELRQPDRPSDNIGIVTFPLSPEPETLPIVLDSVGRFPTANPRRTIGVCHWVLKHAPANSPAATQAQNLISEIDNLILAGRVGLGQREDDAEPRRN